MSIKNKLILIAVSIVVALSSLTAVMKYSFGEIALLTEADGLVGEIEVNMLTLRRNEKDFLARGSLKYRDAFGETAALMEQNLTQLDTSVKSLGIDAKGVVALSESLKHYINGFGAVAAIEESIGLDEKSGLRGSLRKAVHHAEELIKEADDYHLLADMLMLRRNEKDFLMRQDTKYQAQFDDNMQRLLSTLAMAPITEAKRQNMQTSMQKYSADLRALIEASKDKGLTPKDGKLGTMRSTVHDAESLIDEVGKSLRTEIASTRSMLSSAVITAAVVLTLVLVLGVIAVMRSVVQRLSQLNARMLDIAEGEGDLMFKSVISIAESPLLKGA